MLLCCRDVLNADDADVLIKRASHALKVHAKKATLQSVLEPSTGGLFRSPQQQQANSVLNLIFFPDLEWKAGCNWLLLMQVVALLVWFSTVAGCYALFIPVLPNAQWQAPAAALYAVANLAVFHTYFAVR